MVFFFHGNYMNNPLTSCYGNLYKSFNEVEYRYNMYHLITNFNQE